MEKLVVILAVAGLMLACTGPAATPSQAAVIDFDAVALRPASDGTYGQITEWANGNGVTAATIQGGQKVYYGTDYFNGRPLSDIDYIEFTYKRASSGGNNPYTNAVITDGSGNYGVISSQGGYTIWMTDDGTTTEKRMKYYFAGDSGNQAFGFRFYEPSPGGGSWPHGTNIAWSDIQTWQILGVGVPRPLHSGEAGVARGPVDHGLAVMWGDSADNYLGDRDIYDIVVSANGEAHTAGVPEPATLVIWSVLGLLFAGVCRWRKRSGIVVQGWSQGTTEAVHEIVDRGRTN